MYLRESKQKRADGREIVYLQLAENVWDPGKGRSQARIVFNCGRADDRQVIERLRRLAKSILRRCSPEAIVADDPGWRLVCAWPYGDVHALEAGNHSPPYAAATGKAGSSSPWRAAAMTLPK